MLVSEKNLLKIDIKLDPSLDLPDTLLIAPTEDPTNFDYDLLSPKFIGRMDLNQPILINSVRINQSLIFKFGTGTKLYDSDRLLNLQERYVKTVLFNYYPYTSYEEVVSTSNNHSIIYLPNNFKQPPGTGNCNSMELKLTAEEQGNQQYPEKTLHIDGTESLVAIELCKKYNCTLLMTPGV